MKKKLSCIMLVDDNQNDNFFHAREIKKFNPDIAIIEHTMANDALNYLKSAKENNSLKPDLILLDINMPLINGWEFLEQYAQLDDTLQKGIICIMLSTSGSSSDIEKSKTISCVSDYIIKPLTRQILGSIESKYFKD